MVYKHNKGNLNPIHTRVICFLIEHSHPKMSSYSTLPFQKITLSIIQHHFTILQHPNFYFTIQHIKIIFLHNKIIYPKTQITSACYHHHHEEHTQTETHGHATTITTTNPHLLPPPPRQPLTPPPLTHKKKKKNPSQNQIKLIANSESKR